MTAPFDKGHMQLLMPASISYRDDARGTDFAGMEGAVAEQRGTSLRAAVAGLWARLVAIPRRRAVLDELGMLTDRELADIGLNRSDLGRVFEPSFVDARRRAGHAQG